MMVMVLRTDGNHRYSWTRKKRIAVRELDATAHPPLQYNQLMSERSVLCLKPALRLEGRGEKGEEEAEQRDHRR
jgi:hypothetical protein